MNVEQTMRWLERYSFWIFLIFALCATIYLVAPTLNSWFNLEDFGSIQTGMVTSWSGLATTLTSRWTPSVSIAEDNPVWSSGQLTAGLYRPLYALSFYPDWKLWGMNAMGFRLTNGILYLLCGISVYFLGKELFGRKLVGLIGGILYLLNPVHFATLYVVNYRSESLLAVFAITAIALWIKYRKSSNRTYFWASVVFTTLALLSKEEAIALPFVFLAYDVVFHWKLDKRKIVSDLMLPMIALVFYFVVRIIALHGIGSDSTLNLSYISHFPSLMAKGLLSSFYYLIFARTDYLFIIPKYLWVIITCAMFLAAGVYMTFKTKLDASVRYSIFLALAYLLTIGITLPIFDSRFDFTPSAFASLFVAYVIVSVAGMAANGKGRILLSGCLAALVVTIVFWNFVWMDSARDIVRASDYSLRINNEMKGLVPSVADNQKLIFITKPASIRGLAVLGNLSTWLWFLYGKNVDGAIITSVYAKNDFFQPITLTKIADNEYSISLPASLTYTANNGMSGVFAKAASALLCYNPASNQALMLQGVYTNGVTSGSTLDSNIAEVKALGVYGCSIRDASVTVKNSYLAGSQPIYLFFNGQDMERVN